VVATPLCADCGKALTAAQAKFCEDNTERFGDKYYCFEHQKKFKKNSPRALPKGARAP
jgi:predicted amidophosphoribosyltransferase